MPDDYVFEVDQFQSLLQYLESVADRIPAGITSPYHVCQIERFRRDHGPFAGARACPTDVFVFALGEPDLRHVTKIGGVPYRPASKPWPRSRVVATGQAQQPIGASAMTFLAQFCFSGSRDLVGRLPGDVLLVFVDDQWFASSDSFHCEWYPLGLGDLIDPRDTPRPAWEFATCFGYRHRTTDYFNRGDERRETAAERISLWHATKIGGVPTFVQNADHMYQHQEEWPGRFLCQLGHVYPKTNAPLPWINQQAPLRPDDIGASQRLDLVDAGFIYLFLDSEANVHAEFMCG